MQMAQKTYMGIIAISDFRYVSQSCGGIVARNHLLLDPRSNLILHVEGLYFYNSKLNPDDRLM